MDSSNSLENTKRAKVFEEQSKANNEDRISHLPEHVLHYILSFLPTKFAVATSALSTRWKYIWISVHNLDFDDKLVFSKSTMSKDSSRRQTVFLRFVDRVLLLNDNSSIQKFQLACKDCSVARFNKWLPNVMRRNVQELNLSFRKRESNKYKLLSSLLSCKSLRILKLYMAVFVDIPASVCFSSLKVLHLNNVMFSSDDQSIQEISLRCPLLEELVISHWRWLNIKVVNISAPILQMLTIIEWPSSTVYDCDIRIYAKSLISLKMETSFSHAYSLHDLSSLVDASLEISTYDGVTQHMISLLRQISNIRDLVVPPSGVGALALPELSPHLRNLSRVVNLRVVGCYVPNSISGRSLIDLLCNLPNIESLFFSDGISSFSFKGYGRLMGKAPQCFLPHLKYVDVQLFSWEESEIWFVKYLLKSVSVADRLTVKLTIKPYYNVPSELKIKITEQFQRLAKDSNCIIEFA